VFFERCLLVNEQKVDGKKENEATITAHQPKTAEKFGFVFNNCTIENKEKQFNLGRAWGGAKDATVSPMTTYLNTTLNQPSEIVSTRFNAKCMNELPGSFNEYNTKNANGEVISPASNVVTFYLGASLDKATSKKDLETIISAEQAANYTMEKVLGEDFAAIAKAATAQLEAPAANYDNGNVTWTPANNGATAYLIEKNGAFAGITAGSSFAITIDAEKDNLTIRAANGRGGFGEAKQVEGTATGIHAVKAAIERGEKVIYNLAGQRVDAAYKGLVIRDGVKIMQK
jgi:pectin methylesterase-like acyl-CoA thioesterase